MPEHQMRSDPSTGALLLLKRRQALQKQADSTRQQAFNLENMKFALENATTQKEVVDGMAGASTDLKSMNEGLDIDKVEDVS